MNRSLPAIPYMRIVRMYAEAKGIRFITWSEQKVAIQLYNEAAEKLN